MTRNEAMDKLCPFTGGPGGGMHPCVVEKCMAWRDTKVLKLGASKEEQEKLWNQLDYGEKQGYCSLCKRGS